MFVVSGVLIGETVLTNSIWLWCGQIYDKRCMWWWKRQ